MENVESELRYANKRGLRPVWTRENLKTKKWNLEDQKMTQFDFKKNSTSNLNDH